MLARSLALLGAPEDARSLLSSFLTDDDVDLRIRAAGELCRLGDAQLGQRVLRATVRNRVFAASFRLAAAEKLKSVGFLRHAAIAFARIARDENIEVHHRTRAAIAFDELEHRRNYIVWNPLMAILEDRTQAVANRVDAGEALIQIDGEDGYDDLVFGELLEMLDDEELSDRDILRVAASLGERGWTLKEMPRVRQTLKSGKICAAVKIETLKAIGRYGRNNEVTKPLIRIAANSETSVELALKAIDAIWRRDENEQVQALLGQISRDATVPPKWRLKAANAQRADLRPNALLLLAQDDSIDIVTRVTALEALPADTSLRETLLRNIANSAELTFWDRRKIAEAADRLKIPDLMKSVIQSARDDRPLSIWELVELAKLCRELGDEAGAEQFLHQLLALPLLILINCEDTATMLEGIRLATDLDRELAASRLKEIILSDEIGWSSVADALEIYVELVGRDLALADAAPVIEQLSAGLRNSADKRFSGWPWYAEQLLERGFYSDYGSLLAFAEDEENRISERVGACALVMRHAAAASPFYSAARSTLKQMLGTEPASSDKIRVAEELHRAGCRPEMNEWLDRCLASPPEGLKDRRSLAGLLHDLGRVDEAKILVEGMDPADLLEGLLFPTDKALAKTVVDNEIADDLVFEQVLKNDDPLDQIWRAKEYVEEHGDHRALKLVSDAAKGAEGDPHHQLEAIDCLDQLGFRKISRTLFSAMPKKDIEPYWFGAQLLRFGKKLEAVPFYTESAYAEIEYNENLIWSGLADLGLVGELTESRFRFAQRGEGDVSGLTQS